VVVVSNIVSKSPRDSLPKQSRREGEKERRREGEKERRRKESSRCPFLL
jgi:hypothetical protein